MLSGQIEINYIFEKSYYKTSFNKSQSDRAGNLDRLLHIRQMPDASRVTIPGTRCGVLCVVL
jgi:hypothetical protein